MSSPLGCLKKDISSESQRPLFFPVRVAEAPELSGTQRDSYRQALREGKGRQAFFCGLWFGQASCLHCHGMPTLP